MLNYLVITLLIAAPLWAQFRYTKVSALFAAAALAHACCAAVTFYAVIGATGVSASIGLAIIMAFFMGLTMAQERFGAMIYPGLERALFWIGHLAFLVLYWVPTLRFLRPDPQSTDLTAAGDAVERMMIINLWAERIAFAVLFALVVLAIGSAGLRWRRKA